MTSRRFRIVRTKCNIEINWRTRVYGPSDMYERRHCRRWWSPRGLTAVRRSAEFRECESLNGNVNRRQNNRENLRAKTAVTLGEGAAKGFSKVGGFTRIEFPILYAHAVIAMQCAHGSLFLCP